MRTTIIIIAAIVTILSQSCTKEVHYTYKCVRSASNSSEYMAVSWMMNNVLNDSNLFGRVHYNGSELTASTIYGTVVYSVYDCNDSTTFQDFKVITPAYK